jgi:aspartate kinase
MPTLVMKFGGASVTTPECFTEIAKCIAERKLKYDRLVVVVSAMKGMTNQLVSLAHRLTDSPSGREYDMLVTIGERVSISLLAIALHAIDIDAVSYTGSQSGIITSPSHTDASIIDVRPHRILESLEEGKVVVVAGFQGVSEGKEITTLGRGGSDTTAVALGIALGADCVEFFKDVHGIFEADPKRVAGAKKYIQVSYETLLGLVNKENHAVIHPHAIERAKKQKMALRVIPFMEPSAVGTLVSSSVDSF